MTQHPTNALAALIVELDRSPSGFSHAGMADDYGMIVSSYPYYQPDDVLDLGGLRHDPFEHFWDEGQRVHRLRLPDGVSPGGPARLLRDYPDDREGAFGFAKVVIVAAALHALLPENVLEPEAEYEVVMRAVDAGWAWASEDDFYCAEFVAYLYGRGFTLGELRPPTNPVIDDDGPDDCVPLRGPTGLTLATIRMGAAFMSLFATSEQRETLRALKRAVWRYDPAFFEESIDVVFGDEPIHHDALARRHEASRLEDDLVLPPALVTPRMLETWGRGTDVLAASTPLRPREADQELAAG
ncbi:hypothetical protein [Actinomycetospora sp. NBRC 106378]|uniref:hypothetical protein n=1 Tax=Actinomycetospora sp. NBRC 106378 TaxID=3032208 RepID=UPI002557B619|nr:hypothetical protein [Actinomycetospora sp. NBRC 106378]